MILIFSDWGGVLTSIIRFWFTGIGLSMCAYCLVLRKSVSVGPFEAGIGVARNHEVLNLNS